MSVTVTVTASGSKDKVAKVSEYTYSGIGSGSEDKCLNDQITNNKDKYFSTGLNGNKPRTILVIEYEDAPVKE